MSRYQLKLLVMSLSAILVVALAMFALDWFVIDLGMEKIKLGMRSIEVCAPQCRSVASSKLGGFYSTLVSIAFFCALPLLITLAVQTYARVFTGTGSDKLARVSYVLGSIVFFATFGAAYLFSPELPSIAKSMLGLEVARTWAPLLMLLGALLAMIAARYALVDEMDEGAAYKPIVIDPKDRTRVPPTPLSLDKHPTPPASATGPVRPRTPSSPPNGDSTARPRTPSSPPNGDSTARPRTPSSPPPAADLPARARTSSSGPIDVGLRLGNAPLEINMRPPLPEPAPVPDDQIPVAPESGLVIRKRTPSAAQQPARPRVSYAVVTAALSSQGITGTRADGMSRLVGWTDVVGIVARRLPPDPPYDGATFVDIVSTAGATIRIVPWTVITGHPVDADPVERARSIVQMFAVQCLDAKLDNATKAFVNGTGPAAQLRDEKTLEAHDARLA